MNGRVVRTKRARTSSWTLLKPVQPDEKLSEITGKTPRPRCELIKRLWAYIRQHGLQDRQHKAIIHADDKLEAVFNGKRRVNLVELTELICSHTVS